MVLGDGEHHNATNTTWDFLGDRDCIHSLRLYPHAETVDLTTKGYFAASSAGRTSIWLFRSRRRKGRQLEGQRGSRTVH